MHLSALSIPIAVLLAATAPAQGPALSPRPAIILVHGAFADSSSWGPVIERLRKDGFTVVAAANPLRGVMGDAAIVAGIARTLARPVVLVGHSYGGPVITEAANRGIQVKALVYVAGFIPEAGESSLSLSRKFPGSTLGGALTAVALADGDEDLTVRPDLFHAQFAADLPAAQAATLAVTQRPVALAALAEPSGAPSWKRLPSYMIYGTADRNIPAAAMRFMADRAHVRRVVAVDGASHALMLSHPTEVATIIEDAATAE